MIDWQDFQLSWSPDGEILTIARFGVRWATLTLGDVTPTAPAELDADEARHQLTRGAVTVETRSTFGRAWDLRIMAAHAEPEPVALPALSWTIDCAAGHVAWAWGAGAHGLFTLAPADRAGPVLAFTLRGGYLGFVGGDAHPALPGLGDATPEPTLMFAPAGFQLAPGRRWVSRVEASVHPHVDAVRALTPGWLVPLHAEAGETLSLTLPDVGFVPGPGVRLYTEESETLIDGDAGLRQLDLNEARGVTHLEVSWAPRAQDVLATLAGYAVASGRPPSAAAAFVVAEAMAAQVVADPQAADDYLEAFDGDPERAIFSAAALASEAVRTGRPSRLHHARALLRQAPAGLGFGRAAMRTWLAGISLGEDWEGLVDAFARQGENPLAQLELSLVGYRSAESGIPALSGVVNRLGGTLPGLPVGLDDVAAASLVGLLDLCPDEWSVSLRAGACADKTRRRLRASVVNRPDLGLDVMAWLLLGVR